MSATTLPRHSVFSRKFIFPGPFYFLLPHHAPRSPLSIPYHTALYSCHVTHLRPFPAQFLRQNYCERERRRSYHRRFPEFLDVGKVPGCFAQLFYGGKGYGRGCAGSKVSDWKAGGVPGRFVVVMSIMTTDHFRAFPVPICRSAAAGARPAARVGSGALTGNCCRVPSLLPWLHRAVLGFIVLLRAAPGLAVLLPVLLLCCGAAWVTFTGVLF